MTTTVRHRPGAIRTATRAALGPRRWRAATALLLTGVSTLGGCYTSAPLTTTPAPGVTLVLDLNDRGRVALGDSIGTSASRVEGVVQASSDSSYVLRVSSVQYLNGQSNRWSGEPLTVRANLVSSARERRFSRSRTWALGIGAAAAVLTLALSTDLLGLGSIGRSPRPTPPIEQ